MGTRSRLYGVTSFPCFQKPRDGCKQTLGQELAGHRHVSGSNVKEVLLGGNLVSFEFMLINYSAIFSEVTVEYA